ncbi:interaptin-like [Physella acuta]|uniref:interaptin-like n=1 Tax=Physella acuta TaxID=109671 RepID=UPI0027DC6EC7|nr:interaptin-like [Physella acuta]
MDSYNYLMDKVDGDEDFIVVVDNMNDIKNAIQEKFCAEIDPEIFLPVLKKYNVAISQQDEEDILHETRNKGKSHGAMAILDRLVTSYDDLKCLIQVLSDDVINLKEMADILINITGQDNVYRIPESSVLSISAFQSTAGNDNGIDLLLLGKTGNGKSRTGNTILGSAVFKAGASMESVSQIVESGTALFNGRVIKVVDGPGIGDTHSMNDLEQETCLVLDSYKHAFTLNSKGYHAFLLVVKFGQRYTKEDVECVRILKHVFGEDFVKKFGIVIVTCGDNFKTEYESTATTFKTWCSEQGGVFRELMNECDNRVVLFDNAVKDEVERCKQVQALIDVVDKLKSGGRRYSFSNFEKFEESRKLILLQAKAPIIRDETLNKLKLITQKIGNLAKCASLNDQLNLIQNLMKETETILSEVLEVDRETHVLADLIRQVEDVRAQLKGTAKSIKLVQKEQNKNEEARIKHREEIQQLEKTLKMLSLNKQALDDNFKEQKNNIKEEYQSLERKLRQEYELKVEKQSSVTNNLLAKYETQLQEIRRGKKNRSENDITEIEGRLLGDMKAIKTEHEGIQGQIKLEHKKFENDNKILHERKLSELQTAHQADLNALKQQESDVKNDMKSCTQVIADLEEQRKKIFTEFEKSRNDSKCQLIEMEKEFQKSKAENARLLMELQVSKDESYTSIEAKLKRLKQQKERDPKSVNEKEIKKLKQEIEDLKNEYFPSLCLIL